MAGPVGANFTSSTIGEERAFNPRIGGAAREEELRFFADNIPEAICYIDLERGCTFVNNLFLNLGKGGHLPPWLTVWMPHLLFGALGLVLFHYRSQNRDLPRFKLGLSKPKKSQIARPRNRSAPQPGASAA